MLYIFLNVNSGFFNKHRVAEKTPIGVSVRVHLYFSIVEDFGYDGHHVSACNSRGAGEDQGSKASLSYTAN